MLASAVQRRCGSVCLVLFAGQTSGLAGKNVSVPGGQRGRRLVDPAQEETMTSARRVLLVVLGLAAAGSAAWVGIDSAAAAGQPSRVISLDVTTRRPAFGGRSFGSAGAYEVLIGKARAVLDPAAALNTGIVDIDKAPRNADGMIEYGFDVQILKPADIRKGNRTLYYEFNNRGAKLVFSYFNEAGDGFEESNAGIGFLMEQGYTVVSSGWFAGAGAPGANPRALFAQLPIATEHGQPIVGTAREEWIRDTGSSTTFPLSYPAATQDQARAVMTVRVREGDPRRPLPPSQWSFASESTVTIPQAGRADAGSIYELQYQAKNPVVAGIGFAAIRDFVTFLKHAPADEAGHENPLFVSGKPALSVAVSTGTSQSGRLQRDFIYLGFNQDTAGRKVFEGMNPIVGGGRKTFVNYRFAQPGRYTRQHEDHIYPQDEFPFTYATTTDPLTGKTDGLFARCAVSKTCPKVIQLDADTESYQGHGSLVVTDPSGRDVALPSDVRYYYVTTAHGQGSAGCRDAAHGVSPWPYYRAAYDALVRWVRDGTAPPPSNAPSVANKTFVAPADQLPGYPTIPGKPYTATINDLGIRDFSVFPPTESATKYPHFVPRLDRDGNATAGVLIPEVAVPVATISGKAMRAAGFAEGDLCSTNGSSIPFAKTKAERLASGDSRLSFEERYPGGQEEYVGKYTRAVEKLVGERYLLPDDGRRLIAAASRALSQ
jgi:hypothetical protein